MCTFQLHKTTIKQIDKFRKHRLWREQTSMQSNLQMLQGNGLFAKKREGGLGVLNLRTQNDALLLKHLHKIFNRMDIS